MNGEVKPSTLKTDGYGTTMNMGKISEFEQVNKSRVDSTQVSKTARLPKEVLQRRLVQNSFAQLK